MLDIIVALGSVAMGLTYALSMDGVISRAPLEKLANFPFKGLPATNGMTLALGILVITLVAHWLLSGLGSAV